jgi:hypothetical protein
MTAGRGIWQHCCARIRPCPCPSHWEQHRPCTGHCSGQIRGALGWVVALISQPPWLLPPLAVAAAPGVMNPLRPCFTDLWGKMLITCCHAFATHTHTGCDPAGRQLHRHRSGPVNSHLWRRTSCCPRWCPHPLGETIHTKVLTYGEGCGMLWLGSHNNGTEWGSLHHLVGSPLLHACAG